jgi:hypothetical protein
MLHFIYKLFHFKFSTQRIDLLYSRVIIRIANLLLPVSFRLTARSPNKRINEKVQTKDIKLVVSLTTFPARINKVWLVVESILRQRKKPDVIVLWLSKDEFADKTALPLNLLSLEKRGLQIRFCPGNIMSHKKYFYSIQEFPKSTIVIVDDDIFYPSNLLGNLIKANKQFPNSICSAINRKIKIVDGQVTYYNCWDYMKINSNPSFALLSVGAGGTLFPPGVFNSEVLNEEKIIQMALQTDDLWLKVMSLLNKVKVASIAGEYTRSHIPVIQKNKACLMDNNIGNFQNDRDFKKLIEYYKVPVTIFESD